MRTHARRRVVALAIGLPVALSAADAQRRNPPPRPAPAVAPAETSLTTRRLPSRTAEPPDDAIRRLTASVNSGSLTEDGRRQALRERAALYAVTGRRGLAMADVNALLRIDPRDHDAHFAKGLADFLGNPREAARSFSEVIRLQPGRIDGHRARGWANLAAGNYDDAARDFEEVSRRAPGDDDAHRGRGWAHLHARRFDPAIAEFTALLERSPSHGEALLARGLGHYFAGRSPQAYADFRSSMRVRPRPEGARNVGAFSFDDWQRYRRVLATLEQRIARNPRDIDAWIASGVVGYRLFDDPGLMTDLLATATAKSSFDGALKIEPGHTDALLFRAMLFATPRAIYNYPAALADFSEVIRLDPSHAEAYFRRGLLRAVNKTTLAAAVEDCERALALTPGDPTIAAVLEKLKADKRDWDRAQHQASLAQAQRDAEKEQAALLFMASIAALIVTSEPLPRPLGPEGEKWWIKEWEFDLLLKP